MGEGGGRGGGEWERARVSKGERKKFVRCGKKLC